MTPVYLGRAYRTMEHHSQGPFNPHPPFPQWAPHAVYPYPFWGSMARFPEKRRYFMPVLENEYLRVTVAPDIGGRIWDIYDKIGKRHLANYNTGVRSYNAGFGLNYTTGGIEVNYPLAHSCTSNVPREVSFERHPDGSAAIVLSEYDRIWRTRWSMAVRLYPGTSFVEQRVRLYNRTPYESRGMYWNNCSFVLRPNTRYIFPETEGAMHGQEHSTFSWPTWRHRDMSLFRDIPPQALGLYFLHSREPYFGYYDEDDRFGLVHYGDLSDVPGKKFWTWGTDPGLIERYRKTHHTLGEVYGEIQSGRIAIQEHLDRLPPETECQWTERWFPVRDTGAFNGAGPGAAIRAEVLESSATVSRLRIRVMANAAYPRARLRVATDGLKPVDQPMPAGPDRMVERTVRFAGRIGPDQHTALIVFDPADGVLAECRLRHPNRRDSWREVIDVQKTTDPEDLFQAAERTARDWNGRDPGPGYLKVLQRDPGHAAALRELGKIALSQGLPEEAVRRLGAACERDEDSLEGRYYLGLALRDAGRPAESRKAFELAARYDWEMRSLVRLAELRMREQDWHHALGHLDRVAQSHPLLTRPRGLRAACLRKLGRTAEAKAEIAAARKIDGTDPFLHDEAMIIAATYAAKALSRQGLRALISQVRGSEHPLLEAAFDYLSAGLYAEAAAVLETIPGAGALVWFALAWVRHQLGNKAGSRTALSTACRMDPAYQHAWHLEFIPILRWAMAQRPKDPRPAWQLGNLLMARRRSEEAAALWKKAEKLGEKHPLLFASLGYFERHTGKSEKRALACFRKADLLAGTDLYVKHEIAVSLRALKKGPEGQRYLEGQRSSVLASPRLAHDLMNLYLDANDFKKFDALAPACRFPVNWQIPGPHHLWARRQIKEALLLVGAGRHREALEALLHMKPMPENLGAEMGRDFEDDRRFYHIGCLHETLGHPGEARVWWEKALAIPYFSGYEPAYSFSAWSRRYYHALCLRKLGRPAEAEAYFDAMALLAESPDLPAHARRKLMELVERGRFAPEAEKDPAAEGGVTVATRAEL